MELTFGSSISVALLSCLYLSLLTSPASAKCKGKWRIHACFGGNGKRSDPNLEPPVEKTQSFYDKLFSNDMSGLSRSSILEDGLEEPRTPPAYDDDDDSRSSLNQDLRGDYSVPAPMDRKSLQQLRNYVMALKMSQRLRQRQDLY